MKDIIWQPNQDYLQKTNIAQFMKKLGIDNPKELIKKSSEDIEWFWEEALNDLGVEWYQNYSKIVEGELPFASWFLDGKINLVHNCLDRHQKTETKNNVALIWEGDCGASVKLTYEELYQKANALASGLKELGLQKGDAVGLYMPMIPEMCVSFFALLKLGAVIIPIFSGFGPEPTAIRLDDAKAKFLITADGSFRRGKKIDIKKQADLALQNCPSIEKVIVAQRTFDEDIPWTEDRDIYLNDILTKNENQDCPTEVCDSEDHSLIIYTSGTTGKPKGTVHTHAGVMAQVAKEVTYAMDCKKDDTFFWVTDIGWMMGPWEIIGASFQGASLVIFEGAPDYPEADRLWDIVEKYKVTQLGISPTAIRLLKKFDLDFVKKHDLSSLRILGSTGEAWDPESYQWFFENIGEKRCPIINISGGTEIMGCHLSPLPVMPLKSCTLGAPGLGMDVDVFDEDGKSLREEVGYLVCKKPAPSMTKGFLNNKQRYLNTYFDKWEKIWNHGDWAYVDEDGFWFLRGRADDVIKVSGHRTGPAEIESALMQDSDVSEAAAIGVPHSIKGECIITFVVLKESAKASDEKAETLKKEVIAKLGKTLKPEEIHFVDALPKTRSAKIVRAAIKKKYLGQDLGDTASIENPAILDGIPERNV